MKIQDVLALMDTRALPLVAEDDTIRVVLQKMLEYPHTRVMYVVNTSGQCSGVISLGALIRHVFPHSFEPAVHGRSLIHMVTAETAKDIMNTGVISATTDDDVEIVIQKMVNAGIKELPIVDGEKKVFADITMRDLLRYSHQQY